MSDINKWREEIDNIDKKMAELFERRMNISKQIAEIKKINGSPIIDKKRETEIIKKNSNLINDDNIKEYYVLFFKNLINLSVSYQTQLNSGMRIAYTGVEGAFAYIAAKKMYPNAILLPCTDFINAYQEVQKGNCDIAVLPIENSTVGDVGMVIDLIYSGDLFINRIIDIPIEQNLLGIKGSYKKDIKTVYSHPQALAQCSLYIHKKKLQTKECINTAVAAKTVSEISDKTIAAIASSETAELYNLEILEKNINQDKSNATRFACFSRVLNKDERNASSSAFIIVFSVKNEVGSLAKALDIIGSNGFNMKNLRSRPLKDKNWSYYFYAELEGNAFSEAGLDLMIQLKTICDEVKLIGSYST